MITFRFVDAVSHKKVIKKDIDFVICLKNVISNDEDICMYM